MRTLFTFVTTAVFAGGVLATNAFAQSKPLPTTPGDCQKSIASLRTEESKKVQDTTLTPRYTSKQAATTIREFARQCVAQFDPQTIDDAQLVDLVNLYMYARRYAEEPSDYDTKQSQALQRALSNTSVSSAERAKRLNIAIRIFASDHETYPQVVQYVAELDTLSGASPEDHVSARRALFRVYDGYPDQTLQIAGQIEQYVASLDSAAQKSVERIADVTNEKAEAYTRQGYPKRAQELYETKLAALSPKDSAQAVRIRRQIRHYQLYGSKAPTIVAQHWLNAEKGMTQYVPENNVSLIMITAHWCGPCKASYPTIARMSKDYAKKGVETVVVTKTFGFFDDQKDLAAIDEVEADRKFYVDEYKFSMPMAIFETDTTKGADGKRPRNPNEDAYALQGYPTYYVVGRDGVIRDILVGWGGAKSERELTAALERALKDERATDS